MHVLVWGIVLLGGIGVFRLGSGERLSDRGLRTGLKDRAGLGCVAADLAAELLEAAEFGLAAQALHRLDAKLPAFQFQALIQNCLLYTSPSPRD